MADDKNTQTQESPVQVFSRDDVVIGQPQARTPEPHDGATRVRETVVHTDKVIKDPNDPLAVQIPEGTGASTVDTPSPLAEALKAGTAEEQFARERDGNDSAPAATDALGSPQADAEDKVAADKQPGNETDTAKEQAAAQNESTNANASESQTPDENKS